MSEVSKIEVYETLIADYEADKIRMMDMLEDHLSGRVPLKPNTAQLGLAMEYMMRDWKIRELNRKIIDEKALVL